MDGKPLYEYARENKPLPRAIPSRQVKVSVELLEFTPAQKEDGDGGHSYKWPEERLSPEEKDVFRRLTELVDQTKDKTASTATTTPASKIGDVHWPEVSEKTGLRPPTFKIRMTVSGGTYVRSIVNDVGELLGCGAHVVLLRRTRQGRFALHGDGSSISEEEKKIYDEMVQKTAKDTELSEEEAMMSGPASSTKVVTGGGTEDKPLTSEETEAQTKTYQSTTGCIPWSVFERAIAEHKEMLAEEEREKEELIASGMPEAEAMKLFTWEAKHAKRIDRPLKEWEYETLRRFVSVYVPKTGEHNSGMAKRNSYARGGGGGGAGGRRY
jgi:tRNA pseudouridine55 synthase